VGTASCSAALAGVVIGESSAVTSPLSRHFEDRQ